MMMARYLLLALCAMVALVQSYVSPPVTTIRQGRIEGVRVPTRRGRLVQGYLGIPYAAAPTGCLRFKPPQPPRSWEGTYSATRDAPGCIQAQPPRNPLNPSNISEDCLYLNVFTPNVKPRTPYAVLVYIFGGGFETGAGHSSAFGPDYLCDENIILVTFNYRLGILGFLSLDHPVLPGNLGLKDQRAALRWVQENIVYFGGDPRKVTIMGQSSGAACVHYHLIFSAGLGLFRAGIAESGSARSLFALQMPGTQRPLVDKLANRTNCPRVPEELVECLRQVPAEEFEKIRLELKKTNLSTKQHTPVFSPVIEPECVDDAFITDNPWNTTINCPLLMGAVEMEGLSRTLEFEVDKTDKKFMELNDNYKEVLPYRFFINDKAEDPEEVAEMLKQYYFGSENITRDNYLKLVDMVTDVQYTYGMVVSTRTNSGPTYFYQINYRGSNSIVHYGGSTAYYGVSHADELFYLFPLGGPGVRNITESDTRFSKRLVKMWTNFVKFGNPTRYGCPTRWDSVKSPAIEFLNMGQHNYTMDKDFLKARMEFWDNLPFRNKQQTGRPQCPDGW